MFYINFKLSNKKKSRNVNYVYQFERSIPNRIRTLKQSYDPNFYFHLHACLIL